MRRKKLTKYIAGLVSASMLLSVLAPALPAYAANTGYVKFDLGKFGKYNKIDSSKLTLSGDEGTLIKTKYPNLPLNAANDIKLPWMTGASGEFALGRWANNADQNQQVELKNDNFKGYKIENWYANKEDMATGVVSTPATKVVSRFPYNANHPDNTTYYAKVVSDGVTNYVVRTVHSGLPAGITPAETKFDTVLRATEGATSIPLSVPGYKVKASGATETKFYEAEPTRAAIANANSLPTGIFVTEQANVVDNNGFVYSNGIVKGDMVNKDVKVKFNYEKDTESKFRVTVVHHILNKNGDEIDAANPKKIYDARLSYNAGDAVTGIKADQAYIGTDQSNVPEANKVIPKYVLLTADKGSAGHAPRITDINEALLTGDPSKYILGPDDDGIKLKFGNAALPATDDANWSKALSGNMPNQSIYVHYYYIQNEAYKNKVSVEYKDEYGRDISAKVIAALNADSDSTNDVADTAKKPDGSLNKYYKSVPTGGGATQIVSEVNPGTAFTVLAPKLERYKAGNDEVSAVISENSLEFGLDHGVLTATGWSVSNPKFTGTMGDDGQSITITVTYTHDPAANQTILIDKGDVTRRKEGHVKFKKVDGSVFDPESDIIQVEKTLAGVDVKESDLPIVEALPGYVFDGWYYKGTKVESWPLRMSGSTSGDFKLNAITEKAPASWVNFRLELKNGTLADMDPSSPVSVSMPLVDETGADVSAQVTLQNTLTANDVTVTAQAVGYDIVWTRVNNNIESVIQPGDSILAFAGETLYAKAESNLPPVARDLSGEGKLNSTTGEPSIALTTLNDNDRVKYAVVDENGKVVGLLTKSQIEANMNSIKGDYLNAGDTYKVYEVLPNAQMGVGDDISGFNAPEISTTPLTATIPVANTATPIVDQSNTGKVAIKVAPVVPNTEYALLDSNGNVVKAFAVPDSNPLVFDNLDPNKVYKVVARPVGSQESEADRAAKGLDVDTSSVSVDTDKFTVDVVLPTGVLPDVIKVDDVDKTAEGLDSLKDLQVGTKVELVANPVHGTHFFIKWKAYGKPITPVSGTSANTIIFNVPAGNVTLQGLYDSDAQWAAPNYTNTQAGNFDVLIPSDITEPGEYRLNIQKLPMTNSVKDAVTALEGREFKGLWIAHVFVEKKDPNNTWVPYTAYTGELKARINTGATVNTQKYALYKTSLATPTDATRIDGDYIDQMRSPNYQGSIGVNLENGSYYGFGYTKPQIYVVRIKDPIRKRLSPPTLSLTFDQDDTRTVNDFANLYERYTLPNTYIDTAGVTWEYQGLSKERDSFDPYDGNRRVTQDETLYLYYVGDKEERDMNETKLRGLIDTANSFEERARIQALIDAATALVNQVSPRKASNAELTGMYNNLSAEIDRLNNANGGGGRSYGGGGGGGGGRSGGRGVVNQSQNTNRSTNPISNYTTYSVGTDGSWKLVDASKHVWKFESGNGVAVTGWANLAYNYNGERRVETYHFRADGVMDSGWFKDESGRWFYMSEEHDGFFGRLVRGWYKSAADNRWYYLSTADGHMITGWNKVSDVWYYLSPQNNEAPTWRYNEAQAKWEFIGNDVRPLGSMYQNERTPDNYFVNESGAWVEGR